MKIRDYFIKAVCSKCAKSFHRNKCITRCVFCGGKHI